MQENAVTLRIMNAMPIRLSRRLATAGVATAGAVASAKAGSLCGSAPFDCQEASALERVGRDMVSANAIYQNERSEHPASMLLARALLIGRWLRQKGASRHKSSVLTTGKKGTIVFSLCLY
jgi:hypothetical protein